VILVISGGVVKLAPVKSDTPPVAVLNQSYVPPGAVAVSVAVFPEHIICPDADGDAGGGVTVTVTGVRGLMQPLFTCT